MEPGLQTWDDKIEHLWSYAQVVHTTAKQVISRRGKNENVCEMSKMYVQGVQNYCFLLSNMQMCDVLVSVDGSQISPLLFSSSSPYTVALFLYPLLPRCSVFQLQGCWLWTCDKLVPQPAKDASSQEPEDSIQIARENKRDRDSIWFSRRKGSGPISVSVEWFWSTNDTGRGPKIASARRPIKEPCLLLTLWDFKESSTIREAR